MEPGYDYVYLEWSTNGGTTWNPTPLATFNGVAGQLGADDLAGRAAGQPGQRQCASAFFSDGFVVADGCYVNDSG